MERVRHPTPKAVLHHDTLLFRVYRAFRGWIPACLVGETATDERDAHTPGFVIVDANFNPNGVASAVGRNPVGVEGFSGSVNPGSSAARPTLGYEARPRWGRCPGIFSNHRRKGTHTRLCRDIGPWVVS